METFTSNSCCVAISCGYTHPFYHTGWLDSTTTSQQWGPSEGGWASPGSWGQTRPSEQGEDRMGQCIQLRIGRWYIKHNVKQEAIIFTTTLYLSLWDFHPFRPLWHCHNNFVAIKTTVSVTIYKHLVFRCTAVKQLLHVELNSYCALLPTCYCAAISRSYYHPFYHTGWLDSTWTR